NYLEKHRNSSIKTIYVYRNPLDNLVSSFFYHIRKRDESGEVSSIKNYIRSYLLKYVPLYDHMQQQKRQGQFVLCYDQIMGDKKKEYGKLLNYLNIPVDDEILDLAVDRNSIKLVKETEEKQGHAIHSTKGNSKSFVRSGITGDYASHLSVVDVKYIISHFVKSEIDMADFLDSDLKTELLKRYKRLSMGV
ncbi:sulfotransferase domain-containing protein, partial [Vibrio breoganii]